LNQNVFTKHILTLIKTSSNLKKPGVLNSLMTITTNTNRVEPEEPQREDTHEMLI